jgi:hypothetical protein
MTIATASADFLFVNHGTVCILHALTDEARTWVDDHLADDALTWGPSGTVIEPRYVAPILEAIEADGMTIGGVQ